MRWRRVVLFSSLGVSLLGGYYAFPESGLSRLCRSAGTASMILYDYKTSTFMQPEDLRIWRECHIRSAKRLVALAERNGGLYIKVGQGFAVMNHLLPPEYCAEMAVLQNDVRKRPYADIARVIREDFKRSVEEIFVELEKEPLAAASMAQVHRATLRDENTGTMHRVAVKVQYPDVAGRFEGDLGTIQMLSKCAGIAFPGFDFSGIMQRVRGTLYAELDFLQECANNDKCGEHMRAYFPKGDVIVPKVFYNASSHRVMTTQYIDHAFKVNDVYNITQKLRFSTSTVAKLFIDAFAVQIFRTGFVHADPHPGNVLVRQHPDGKHRPQLIILDHGLYTTLSEKDRGDFAEVWRCVALEQDDGLKTVLKKTWGIDNYYLFATVMMQRPYKNICWYTKKPLATPHGKLNPDEVNIMRRFVLESMAETTEMLKVLPMQLTWLLRNLNTVRAVHFELGGPVNRLARMTIMAIDGSVDLAGWRRSWVKVMAMCKITWELWLDTWKLFLLKRYYPQVYQELMEFQVIA